MAYLQKVKCSFDQRTKWLAPGPDFVCDFRKLTAYWGFHHYETKPKQPAASKWQTQTVEILKYILGEKWSHKHTRTQKAQSCRLCQGLYWKNHWGGVSHYPPSTTPSQYQSNVTIWSPHKGHLSSYACPCVDTSPFWFNKQWTVRICTLNEFCEFPYW